MLGHLLLTSWSTCASSSLLWCLNWNWSDPAKSRDTNDKAAYTIAVPADVNGWARWSSSVENKRHYAGAWRNQQYGFSLHRKLYLSIAGHVINNYLFAVTTIHNLQSETPRNWPDLMHRYAKWRKELDKLEFHSTTANAKNCWVITTILAFELFTMTLPVHPFFFRYALSL